MPKNTFSRTIFVGCLVSTITEEQLRSAFAGLDGVGAIKIVRDEKTNQCKGYAFVTIEGGKKNLDEALEKEIFFEGRLLDTSIAHGINFKANSMKKQMDHKIHVKNLKQCVDDQEMKDFFGQFGDLHNAYVIYNPHTKQSKRFGYVEYKDKATVDKVLAMKDVYLKNKKLVLSRFIPRAMNCFHQSGLETNCMASGWSCSDNSLNWSDYEDKNQQTSNYYHEIPNNNLEFYNYEPQFNNSNYNYNINGGNYYEESAYYEPYYQNQAYQQAGYDYYPETLAYDQTYQQCYNQNGHFEANSQGYCNKDYPNQIEYGNYNQYYTTGNEENSGSTEYSLEQDYYGSYVDSREHYIDIQYDYPSYEYVGHN